MLHPLSVENHAARHTTVYRVLFAAITFLLSAVLIYYLLTYRSLTAPFFQEDTIAPVPENYSAPYETRRIKGTRKAVIGFLPSWEVAQEARVYPEYLDQIVYFGLGINADGSLIRYDENNNLVLEWHYLDSDYFKAVIAHARSTNTRILVAIKNFDNATIDQLISNPQSTKRAIVDLSALIEDYQLDGINIDFEYVTDTNFPTQRFYNSFLAELVTALKKKNPKLIISCDVNATAVYQDNAYDMVKIGELMDQVIVMGYDYHQPSSVRAGSVSPVSAPGDQPSLSRTLDSLKGRVPAEKIILALPFYGYEWQTYTDKAGDWTVPKTGALATYKRVRELIENREVSIHVDELAQTPYLVYRQNGLIRQVHYEDEASLAEKIALIHERNLGGMGIWALGYEGDYIEPWIIIKNGMWGK